MSITNHIAVYLIFCLLSPLVVGVKCRPPPPELVSDGIRNDLNHHHHHHQVNQADVSSYLLLPGMESSDECKQMYGFLPCSNSIFGHLFLILVYEYLLFHGESYLVEGGEQMFKILGPGVFGASAFHVLGALPEALLLLASELLNSKEEAQEYIYTGVGLLAGSTILQLTVIWGTCVIVGSQVLHVHSGSETNYLSLSHGPVSSAGNVKLLSILTGTGVTTDLETSYVARIMVSSLIPFLIIQIVKVLSPSGKRAVMLIALIVSLVFLLFYFFYQIFQPWIQQRRLEYVKHEHLILRILKHVQQHALNRIFTEDGAPNVDAIRRLFEEVDQDGDDLISPSELRELLVEVKYKGLHIDREEAIAQVMKEFDLDRDKKITRDEFINGFTKWLVEAKNAMNKRHDSRKSLRDIYLPWIQKKREEREMKKNLISEILEHVECNAIGSLLREDGTPDTSVIRRLFEKIDQDGDGCISQHELRKLIEDIKFGKVPFNADEAVAKVIEELDTSGDGAINQEEFLTGIAKLLKTANSQNDHEAPAPKIEITRDDMYQRTWEETDKLVDGERSSEVVDKSGWAWFKAIMYMVLGVVILAVLAEPLIYSVENFSNAANISSFFFSFILVPLATNFRAATSAISAACRKKRTITSLAFSEIYGGVFMNNILGFSVLLSLVYVRGLAWEFSAEVLVVVIVCGVMGLIASFRSTFPVWMSLLAYLLYPLSLFLVYFLDVVLNYS